MKLFSCFAGFIVCIGQLTIRSTLVGPVIAHPMTRPNTFSLSASVVVTTKRRYIKCMDLSLSSCLLPACDLPLLVTIGRYVGVHSRGTEGVGPWPPAAEGRAQDFVYIALLAAGPSPATCRRYRAATTRSRFSRQLIDPC